MTEQLKLNALRVANIPPPMSLHEITLPDNIIDVTLSPGKTSGADCILAVLHHEGLSLFDWSLDSVLQSPPHLRLFTSSNQFPASLQRSRKLQITLLDDEVAIWLNGHRKHFLITVRLHAGSESIEQFELPTGAQGLVSNGPGLNHKFCILDNTSVSSGRINNHTDPERPGRHGTTFSADSSRVQAIRWRGVPVPKEGSSGMKNGADSSSTESIITFTLGQNGSLFADSRNLLKTCTSFSVTPNYLLCTTTQHLLKLVHLNVSIDGQSPAPLQQPH